MRLKLVCFDLDDTLIREIHSAMFPCILNGKEKEHAMIQEREERGELDYISADYLRAELMKGLSESRIRASFMDFVKPLDNIGYVVDELHKKNILSIIVTVGPKQVARAACDIWGFDDCYGSDYEVVDSVFTGKIRTYINANDKVKCLHDFCKRTHVLPHDCIAVGDGLTDLPMFKHCGKSIAINAKQDVKERATHFIDTQNLTDILQFIV